MIDLTEKRMEYSEDITQNVNLPESDFCHNFRGSFKHPSKVCVCVCVNLLLASSLVPRAAADLRSCCQTQVTYSDMDTGFQRD